MTKNQPIKLLASSLLAFTLLSACGGGGEGGRPTVDEISTSLQDADNPTGLELEETQADCIAQAFHDSEVSDEALQAIVDMDEDYEGSDEDQEALKNMSTDGMMECMAG